MNIAYVRVSTEEQNEARQLEALKKYGIDEWFIEKVSAKDTNRPELQRMIDHYVRGPINGANGDTIYIHSLDRLARSTKDLLDIIEKLQAKGVPLVSSKESFDTSTATGKLMYTMLGAIAEFERNNMLERQREGIAIAVKNGKYKGRKKIDFPKNWTEVYDKWKQREMTAADAMKKLGLKRNTFYNLIKECDKNNNDLVDILQERKDEKAI